MYGQDSWSIKGLVRLVPSGQMVAAANDAQVLLVWALDAVHTTLIATSLWNYFSLGFGDASQTDLSDTQVPSLHRIF